MLNPPLALITTRCSWCLAFSALLACAVPTLLAFNLPPSATFINQAAAVIGWGGFLLLLAEELRSEPDAATALARWQLPLGLGALLGALALAAVAALAASVFNGLPRSLALSNITMIAAACTTTLIAAAFSAAGKGRIAFQAVCVALIVAALLSVAISLVQVYGPELAEGGWIANAATEGRASGNLRQPNHLSSLLLWALIATVWLAQAGTLRRELSIVVCLVFLFGLVLTASRTGTLGVIMLALWGLLDRRLAGRTRLMLLLMPVVYWLFWFGLSVWAHESNHAFAGESRFSGDGDISSSRFKIWSNTLWLIAHHPWLGVGFGEFNFAWSLTPFPNRPVAFFDHTHNLPLHLIVELGLPLGTVVLSLLGHALWRAFVVGRDDAGPDGTMWRAAFMMVLMIALHSQLEYPLWYAYFLLPTAFCFGLCLGADKPLTAVASRPAARLTGPWLLAASGLVFCGGVVSLIDYSRVVAIFAPGSNPAPLSDRIESGEHSWLFAHHAHYAAATTAERPSEAMPSFAVATHFLLDTRLMMAWAHALQEAGDTERARHIAQRLREFHNPDSKEFFEPCDEPATPLAPLPFQCIPPTRAMDYQDFRSLPSASTSPP